MADVTEIKRGIRLIWIITFHKIIQFRRNGSILEIHKSWIMKKWKIWTDWQWVENWSSNQKPANLNKQTKKSPCWDQMTSWMNFTKHLWMDANPFQTPAKKLKTKEYFQTHFFDKSSITQTLKPDKHKTRQENYWSVSLKKCKIAANLTLQYITRSNRNCSWIKDSTSAS